MARRIARTIGASKTSALGAAALAGVVLPAATAWACPSCPIAQAARAQVCEQAFAQNLLIALAPFVLVALTCVWAEQIGRPRRSGS